MTEHLPPRPWTWIDHGTVDRPIGTGFVYLLDANGRKIGTLWGKPAEKVAMADLICKASEGTIIVVAADYSETDEIAARAPHLPAGWSEAFSIARSMLPGEGEVLISNLAESLMRRAGKS
jgi:hypothetical protein